jgi:hypothetical protein
MLRKLVTTVLLASSGLAASSSITLHEVLDAFDLLPSLDTLSNPSKTFSKEKPLLAEMSCNDAIDQLLADAANFNMGSIFYVLLNGWYLGSWGDYTSCVSDATFGQYVLVTIEGQYD